MVSKRCPFTGNYEVKEQYFIYDGNALIADIGGYFCMFLSLSRFLSAAFEYLMMKKKNFWVKKKPGSFGINSNK